MPTSEALRRAYNEAVSRPSDIHEHVPYFADLAARGDQTIIELGTRSGVSTVGWLFGINRAGSGEVFSVDIDPAPEMPFPETAPWTFLQGNDLSLEVLRALPDKADVVFIDTSHDHDQTLAELYVYRDRVKPGGLILLHDTEVRHPYRVAIQRPFPVKRAVETFVYEENLHWTNRPNCFGLGVIEVP